MRSTIQLVAFATTLLSLTAPVAAWNDGYGNIASGYFSVIFTGQDQLDRSYSLRGENHADTNVRMIPCDETHWISTDSFLPYVLSCRGGANFCANSLSFNDDWMAVKYAADLVNVQTDSRCGHVDDSYYDHYRCIIKI